MTTQTRKPDAEAIDYSAYDSAVGLNWYSIDPNLRGLVDRYVPAADRDWAEAVLQRWGELCGGPIASRAETIDKNPPQLQHYDPWGKEVSRIVHHPDAIAQKKDIWEEGPRVVEARAARAIPTVLGSAWSYLLSQSIRGWSAPPA